MQLHIQKNALDLLANAMLASFNKQLNQLSIYYNKNLLHFSYKEHGTDRNIYAVRIYK